MSEAFIGKIMDRKYRLLSELGRGAMGVVYRAEQLDAEGQARRIVAVKTLKAELSQDRQFARRFLREVSVSMQLRSPHTVTVYDSGKDDTGQRYYVMEYMPRTLKDYLRDQGPLPVEQSISIACQMCAALAEAHSLPEPIVHRDIKPANIFIEDRGGPVTVKIGDFGIAKIISEHTTGLTHTGQLSPGTPRYMAPEQWRVGEAIDGRTDLYSVGIVLYEMIVGEPPFSGPISVLMGQHLHVPLPPLSERIPPRVRWEIERLTAKKREERPPDALSASAALEAALAAERSTFLFHQEIAAPEKAKESAIDFSDSEEVKAREDEQNRSLQEHYEPLREAVDIHRADSGSEQKQEGTNSQKSPLRPRSLLRPFFIVLSIAGIGLLIVVFYSSKPRQVQENKSVEQQKYAHPAQEVPPHEGMGEARYLPPKPEQKHAEVEQREQEGNKDRSVTRAMVTIPAGAFFMGCNDRVDRKCAEDEKPGRQVFVDAFLIDKTEVSVGEYRRCVQAGICVVPKHSGPACNWLKTESENHPMNCLGWHHAAAFCRWDNNKRLPTEAEWEKAARGTDGRVYPWGNEWKATMANVDGMADGYRQTATVGSFPVGASPYGTLDMAGNVWEWVQDWYDETYYRSGAVKNPQGPMNGTHKVLRGGSWLNPQGLARTSARFWPSPDLRRGSIGFRCAREP